ncbi:variant 2, Scarecrow-like protein 3 [Lathyrus oleraceus]|uniref:Variant 2, Scarecrow-like protein 3 n=1 Tax=Pisum sativum TaxID=3888 RepID=A0A9D5AEB6_PEA|nr:variant 2, Scarecrow-like protein 3 [Pisum sativum]
MNQSTSLGDLLEKDTVNGYSPSPGSASSSSSPASPTASMNAESFLNALWSLSPKVMVVTEQDSNHNGSTLTERLLEALYSYATLFDCLESTTPTRPTHKAGKGISRRIESVASQKEVPGRKLKKAV